MNKLIITSSFLFFILNGYAQQRNLIPGSWSMDAQQSLDLISTAKRIKYDTLKADKKARIVQSFNSRRFTFTDDGNVKVSWTTNGVNKEIPGTWQLVDPDKFIIIYDNSYKREYKIVSLDASKLILQMPEGDGGMFEKLYLRRE